MKMRSALAFLAMLFGCRSRECAEPDARPRAEPSLRAALARVAQAGEVNVLVLSGGGSRGAFGAGVLKGLRESGRRPQYSVVTGVSTGALLATHAFLGTDVDDLVLEKLYAGGVTDADIFKKRSILTLPFADSLTSFDPLARLIERFVNDNVLLRVANEAGDRRCYVATTNMDAGLTKVWDMVELARSHDFKLYRQVLLASSSVPFIHPPVYIRGVHHADGGVREQALLRQVMFGIRKAMGPLMEPTVDSRGSVIGTSRVLSRVINVWLVLNGKLNVEATCVQPRLLDIAQRGVEVLSAASAVGTLHQSYATAQAVGATWRLARISDDLPLGFDAMTFDPVGMAALFEYGRDFGKNGRWEEKVPGVIDATRGFSEGLEE